MYISLIYALIKNILVLNILKWGYSKPYKGINRVIHVFYIPIFSEKMFLLQLIKVMQGIIHTYKFNMTACYCMQAEFC